jgi:hypothetical protein
MKRTLQQVWVQAFVSWSKHLSSNVKQSTYFKARHEPRRTLMMEYIKSWLKQVQCSIKASKIQEVPQLAELTVKKNQNITQKWRWDTYSYRIHVDNCASYSISNDIKDFVTKSEATNKSVKGISGTISQEKTGTILWYIEDNNGKVHKMVLPGSLYIPESPSKLFSPQHWAQVGQEQLKTSDNQCITYADRVVLLWDNEKVARAYQYYQAMEMLHPCSLHQDIQNTQNFVPMQGLSACTNMMKIQKYPENII